MKKNNVNNIENNNAVKNQPCPSCPFANGASGVGIVVEVGAAPSTGSKQTKPTASDSAKFSSIPAGLRGRIAEMEAKGIDTSKYFSIQNAMGEGTLMAWDNGVPKAVTEDDLVEALKDVVAQEIFDNGYIKNTRLHRRWVMAHVFKMLDNKRGFNDSLRKRGYEYMWKMLVEEFRVQSILAKSDPSCALERSGLIPISLIKVVAKSYIDNLGKFVVYKINNCRHKCKGIPYVHIGGQDVFVEDIQKKIVHPLKWILFDIDRLQPTDFEKAYKLINKFNNARVKLPKTYKMDAEFVDAFKASGAYYTTKNLIQFHGCQVKNGACWLTQSKSLAELDKKRVQYKGEGWRLFAFMKKVIEDNKFDYRKRMIELGVYKK